MISLTNISTFSPANGCAIARGAGNEEVEGGECSLCSDRCGVGYLHVGVCSHAQL